MLPTTVDRLPPTASGWPTYLRVTPLNVGDTVSLDWQWKLPIETGNDVQGDVLSFTINYLLEGFPPASPAVGVISSPAPPPGTTDVRGIVTTTGRFTRSVTALSEDGLCKITIPVGTV